MKCRFAKFLFKAFGITGGALAVVLIALMVVCTLVNNYFTRRAAKGRELV